MRFDSQLGVVVCFCKIGLQVQFEGQLWEMISF